MKTCLSALALIVCGQLGFADALSPLSPNNQGKIDLVAVGAHIFEQHCIICHDTKTPAAGEAQLKIGPSMFSLLQTDPAKRKVFFEEKLVDLDVDEAYIRASLLFPARHLATKNEGGAILPYPPGMPNFRLKEYEFQAVIAYLRTLNDPDQKGPAELWVNAPKEGSYPDAHEIRVTSKPKIVRAAFEGVSTRAIAVGNPSGIHYIFDPAWLSVRKVWKNGFVNLKAEHTARGAGVNKYGKNAEIIDFGFAIRPLAGNMPVDFSHSSFPTEQSATYTKLRAELVDPSPHFDKVPTGIEFLGYQLNEQSNPVFHYKIGDSIVHQEIEFTDPETMILNLNFNADSPPLSFMVDTEKIALVTNKGSLIDGVLSFPQETTSVILTLSAKN